MKRKKGAKESPFSAMKLTLKPDAAAFLTPLAGKFSVKEPKKNSARLTWTAQDLGGPCVETFG